MAFRNGPTFPAIQDGLVYHIDPLDSRYYNGGSTIQSSASPFSAGTLSGGIDTDSASWPNGYFEFDGTDDKITFGDLDLGGTAALSALAWVYLDDTSNTTIIGKYASNNWNIGIYSGLWFGINAAGWNGLTGDNPPTGEWSHVAGTWDGSTRKVYINGVENASDSKSGTITYGSQDVVVGNLEGASGFYYDGKMGPIQVYDRGLSADEILKSYNQLKGRFS